MVTLTRSKRTVTRDNGKPEHYWLLSGPDGVLSFCAIECSDLLAHAYVDGVPWMSFGVDAHVPLARCVNPGHTSHPDYGHVDLEDCGLIPDVPCCLTDCQSSVGIDLLNRWIAAGRDGGVIWAELDARYADMVTANVRETPEIERGCTR
jgi:hypothetical protein